MFGDTDFIFQDYDYEGNKILQDYERHGDIGVLLYGEDDADEDDYEKQIVIYRKPVIRSRKEIMQERARLYSLGVYEDDLEVKCDKNNAA